MDKSTSLLEEATKQMNDGKFSRAFTLLKDLLTKDPTHHEGRRLLATLLLKFGNLVTAKNAFDSLLKEAFQHRDYDMAESLLREYLAVGPRCVSFIEMLGEVHECKGDFIAAVIEYEKAIKVLLDDSERDGDVRARALYARVKTLAPGSFVAGRLAAKFESAPVPLEKVTEVPASSSHLPSASPETHAPVAVLVSDVSPATGRPIEETMAAPDFSMLVTDVRTTEAPSSVVADFSSQRAGEPVTTSPLRDAVIPAVPSLPAKDVPEPSAPAPGVSDAAIIMREEQTDSTSTPMPEGSGESPSLRFASSETKSRLVPDPGDVLEAHEVKKVPFPPVNQMPLSASTPQEQEIASANTASPAQPDEHLQPPFWEKPEESAEAPAVTSEDRDPEPAPTSAEGSITSYIAEPSPAQVMAVASPRPVEEPTEDVMEETCEPPLFTNQLPRATSGSSAPVADSGAEFTETDHPEHDAEDAQSHFTPAFSTRRRKAGPSMRARLRMHVSIATRRCVTAAGSVTRLVMFLTASTVTLALLGVGVIAIAWLGLEEKPTELYRELTLITAPRILDDPQANGYVLLLGFEANAQVNPLQEGHDRRLSSGLRIEESCLRPEAVEDKPSLASWFRSGDPATQFKSEDSRVHEWAGSESVFVNRYRQWLNMSFDDWGYGYMGSPDCEHILRIHRLFVAEGFSQDLPKGLDRLETDLAAWRGVLSHAKTLSMKVMAAEAIQDDVAVMSGLLSRSALDNRSLQRMIRLARPLDSDERSLRWPMQNEFLLEVKRVESRLHAHPEEDAAATMAIKRMPVPKQRTLNAYAKYYDALIKTPHTSGRMAPKLYDFAHSPARNRADSFINPLDNLLRAEPMVDWERQISGIVDMDARLRLIGLQARLRGTSTEQQILAKVAHAGPAFFDPFTELPMLLNVPQSRIYSVGRDGKDDGGDATFDISVPIIAKIQ